MKGTLFSLIAIPRAIRYQRTYDHIPQDWGARLLHRLQEFVRYAFDHSSFYRQQWHEVGVSPDDIRLVDDFHRLPVIPSKIWRAQPDDELNPNPVVVFRRKTGGTSSGLPIQIPFTLRDELHLRTMVYAGRYYQGAHWYDRPLSIAPPDPRFRPTVWSIRVGEKVAADPGSPDHAHALAHNQSGVVTGYSIVLWRAIIRAQRERIDLPGRRVIQVGGEVLTDTMRRVISDALGAPVRQIYGATDYGRMAIDCPQGHLHVSPEATYVEVLVDGRAAMPGEVGEIVVTNFASHARPLIRVRTGDFGAWGAEKCPCGNPLPYLAHITGRKEDRIILPDGRVVYWPDIESALIPVKDHVLGYQAQQIRHDSVLVRLTLDDGDELSPAYEECLRDLFVGMSLQVEYTDILQPESSGKTRIVIGSTSEIGSA